MTRKRYFSLLSLTLIILLGIRWYPDAPRQFSLASTSAPTTSTAFFHEQFITFDDTPIVHAPSITERADGLLIAAWFAGSEEGAHDVRIMSTTINPQNHTLSPATALATVSQTEKSTWRYIRKLGNPVIYRLPDERIMLLYVSVSFGGWAASRLNIQFSDDNGRSWSQPKRLVTSPSMNISTLVKGTPLMFDNGDIGVPVYHEFMGKFGELLILDMDGNVKDKRRISRLRNTIQPVVSAISHTNAVAILRDSGEHHKRVHISRSDSAGQYWTPPRPTTLPNPNSAVTLHSLGQDELIAIFNNHEDERYDLSIAYSADAGEHWKVIRQLEYEPVALKGQKNKFSYPYLIRDSRGNSHLLYTWRKQRIKYLHFNEAWLRQQL